MSHPPFHLVQVLKFGSSVLRTEDDLPDVAAEVHRRLRAGVLPVVVISAFRGRTDRLVALADRLDAEDADRASLLGLGEQEAATAVAAALRTAGLPVRLIAASEVGIVADGDAVEANPVAVDPAAVRAALAEGEIPIVPGYVARGRDGRARVLGRGGSDLTAISLAASLGAEAILIKASGAVYERDPALPGPPPRRFRSIDFDDALALGDRVIQPRAIRHARVQGTAFRVTGLRERDATTVHAGATRLDAIERSEPSPDRPRRIALLGLGTVGAGVASLLSRHPDRCELVGALVRDVARPRTAVPAGLRLTTDPDQLFECEPDIVIEMLGGVESALDLAIRAIDAGAHLVTANKTLIAAHGCDLERLASDRDRRALVSACVGGGLPVLELASLAHRHARIVRVQGVLNGTTAFVLSRLGEGVAFEDAIEDARRRGFAEADVSADLGGIDAACKLTILARTLGIDEVTAESIPCDVLDERRAAAIRGTVVRQIADLDLRA
ncbi:MAG: aspartate kinase, partial [Planctomycetota bacterium]|nr:aspartate kinase [Planctomycetota bacterium]